MIGFPDHVFGTRVKRTGSPSLKALGGVHSIQVQADPTTDRPNHPTTDGSSGAQAVRTTWAKGWDVSEVVWGTTCPFRAQLLVRGATLVVTGALLVVTKSY